MIGAFLGIIAGCIVVIALSVPAAGQEQPDGDPVTTIDVQSSWTFDDLAHLQPAVLLTITGDFDCGAAGFVDPADGRVRASVDGVQVFPSGQSRAVGPVGDAAVLHAHPNAMVVVLPWPDDRAATASVTCESAAGQRLEIASTTFRRTPGIPPFAVPVSVADGEVFVLYYPEVAESFGNPTVPPDELRASFGPEPLPLEQVPDPIDVLLIAARPAEAPPGLHTVTVSAGTTSGVFPVINGFDPEPLLIAPEPLTEPPDDTIDTTEPAGTANVDPAPNIAVQEPGGSETTNPPDPLADTSEPAAPAPDEADTDTLLGLTERVHPVFEQENWPAALLISFLLAILALMIIGWSSDVVNKTIEQNRPRILRSRVGRLLTWTSGSSSEFGGRVAFITYVVFLATLLAAAKYVERTDVNPETVVVEIVALVVALTASLAIYANAVEHWDRRFGNGTGVFTFLPWTIWLSFTMVGASVVLGWDPPYVYGLVAAFLVSGVGGQRRERDGRAVLVGAMAVLVAIFALGALLQLSPFDATTGGATPDGMVDRLVGSSTVALHSLLIQVGVFALLPLRFMDGNRLWRYSSAWWAVAYGAVVWLFIYDTTIRETASTSGDIATVETVALFVAFGAASLLFWSYFRWVPERGGDQALGTTIDLRTTAADPRQPRRPKKVRRAFSESESPGSVL